MKGSIVKLSSVEADQMMRKCLNHHEITSLDALKDSIKTFNLLFAFLCQKDLLDDLAIFLEKIPDQNHMFAATYVLASEFEELIMRNKNTNVLKKMDFDNEK